MSTTIETQNINLEKAIIIWIKTFPDLLKKPENFSDLLDGQIFTEILHKIAPQQFDLSKISQDAGENFVLRLNNLNYLYEGLENFYTNVINVPFDKSYVDIMSLAKNSNQSMLYNLVEYIIGALFNSEQKEECIKSILNLDESLQTELVNLFDTALTKFSLKYQSGEVLNSTNDHKIMNLEKQNSSNIGKSEYSENKLLNKLDELENENQMLTAKLDEVIDERDKLKLKTNELLLELTKKSEEIKHLTAYKDQIMKQLSIQEINDDLQNELKFKDKKIMELNKYIEELRSTNEAQITSLRDESDNYKKKLSQLSKIEITLEFYKQKFEDCAKLNEKLNELESQNDLLQTKLHEYEKQLETMNAKFKKVVDQYTAEKDKNINLELTITKKDAEIEVLRIQKQSADNLLLELETQVNQQKKIIEKYANELDRSNNLSLMNNAETVDIVQGYNNESEYEDDSNIVQSGLNKPINDVKLIEKLINENDKPNEELTKKKALLEVKTKEYEALCTNVDSFKKMQEVLEKTKEENQALKKHISENTVKINELKVEIQCQKQVFMELEEQREEELRVLSSALHELAIKNYELDKKLTLQAHHINEQKIKNTITSPASNVNSMKNNFKK